MPATPPAVENAPAVDGVLASSDAVVGGPSRLGHAASAAEAVGAASGAEAVGAANREPAAGRSRGGRSRAGNAMGRSRSALFAGAVKAAARYGARHATMSDISSEAGIAKGTLYNHFRTKAELFEALALDEVRRLVDECAPLAADDLAVAVATASWRLSSHPVLRRLASDEPAVVAALAAPGPGAAWTAAREGVARVLAAAGVAGPAGPAGSGSGGEPIPAVADAVLRHVASHILAPGTEAACLESARVLVSGVTAASGR